jgi:hypothetical protein
MPKDLEEAASDLKRTEEIPPVCFLQDLLPEPLQEPTREATGAVERGVATPVPKDLLHSWRRREWRRSGEVWCGVLEEVAGELGEATIFNAVTLPEPLEDLSGPSVEVRSEPFLPASRTLSEVCSVSGK